MTVTRVRKPPKVMSDHAYAIKACSRHLKELVRFQKRPPPEAKPSVADGRGRVVPVETSSYCSSPLAPFISLMRSSL